MSYVPSPYTGYYNRMDNTVISGNQLVSYLTGEDVRDLEFEAAIKSPPTLLPTIGPSTLTSAASALMTPQQLIQATVRQQGVVWANTAITGGTGYINLGPDTASQALTYINLLNLTDASQKRTLRFALTEPLQWANTILIGNSSNTATYIVPRNSYTGTATNTGSTILFQEATASGPLSGRDGNERLVRFSATGSPPSIVYVDVLGSSA